MDKSRDVRRVAASRFSLARRQLITTSGETKKEKVRKLSFVREVNSRNEDCEMGSLGSDLDDEVRRTVSKRIKSTKRFLDECNTITPPSFPRKLRSASKKRNCKSRSPSSLDSKKTGSNVNGALKKDAVKKSKLEVQQDSMEDSPTLGNAGTITKEEEEVVETLYALAGMFSDTKNGGEMDKTKLNESSGAGPLVSLDEGKASQLEVPEMKQSSDCASAPNCRLNIKEPITDALQTDMPSCDQRLNKSEGCVPQINLPTLSVFSKAEIKYNMPPCNPIAFDILAKPSAGSISMEPKNEELPSGKISLLPASETVEDGSCSELHPQNVTECMNNGLSLMGPSAGLPAWLTNATYARKPCSLENVEMTTKVSRVSVERKSWKRCSAHVYISRLIEVLQITERKDQLHAQNTHGMSNDGSKQDDLTTSFNLYGGKNELASNGVVPSNDILYSTGIKHSNDVRSATLLHKRLIQELQPTSTTSELYALQKQGYNFLSSSSGSCEIDANNRMKREGNRPEAFTQNQVPYLQSLPQNHMDMKYLFPQNYYNSYTDYHSASPTHQVQVKLPSFLGGAVHGPSHYSITTPSKQQQQQQEDWVAYVADRYKTTGIASTNNFPNWPDRGSDSPTIQCPPQSLLPSSNPSLDSLGPRCAPIFSTQKRQFIEIHSSLPPSRIKRQLHHLPSSYEENGGTFHLDGGMLKLLSNGRF